MYKGEICDYKSPSTLSHLFVISHMTSIDLKEPHTLFKVTTSMYAIGPCDISRGVNYSHKHPYICWICMLELNRTCMTSLERSIHSNNCVGSCIWTNNHFNIVNGLSLNRNQTQRVPWYKFEYWIYG